AISGDEQIDTVFLDLMMPEVGGLELLKRIRSEIKRNINAVIVTAKKSMQDLIMAKELGISGYLTKPFDPGKLVIIANQASNEKKTM
ncbi:MAG TPA: response regulator, partial [Candidatus Wallbacteria bacterium]|nr:response regulator [Candidatus Wallbacteria bacterium]